MKNGRVLIIACGALARELGDVLKGARLEWVDIECLPAVLHNTPQLITDAVRERLDRASGRYESVFVGYADCGTGGTLDRLLDERGIVGVREHEHGHSLGSWDRPYLPEHIDTVHAREHEIEEDEIGHVGSHLDERGDRIGGNLGVDSLRLELALVDLEDELVVGDY